MTRQGREDESVLPSVRQEVTERDGSCCRVCGRYVEHPALHHIDYRSEGGPNTPENLIVIGWLPGHDCHLPVVHANKRLWQPILKIVVATPGLTAFAARRQLELQGRLTDNGRSRLGPEVLELRRQVPRGRRPLVGWEPGLADEATGDGPSAM